MHRILIVDDEDSIRLVLKQALLKYGFAPFEASSGAEAIRAVKSLDIDLVLLDIVMPGLDGMETLLELKKIDANLPVIMVTGQGDISTAVKATKTGAYDFVTKPLQIQNLVQAIERGLEQFELQRSVTQLQTLLEMTFGPGVAMKGVIERIREVSWGNATVVIKGEAGTGKSLIARIIHNLSKRARLPFRSARMDAIPEDLVESELFGGEKGPDGPAHAGRGLIERARGGTVFIDGLKHIPLSAQDTLLKAMKEQSICPLNTSKPVPMDARLIFSTDTDLKTLLSKKRLIEGLGPLLGESVIALPPLRERMEDVRFLAGKFLWIASVESNRLVRELDEDAIDVLMHYNWPGNVRELEGVVRGAVFLSKDGVVGLEQLKLILDAAPDDRTQFTSLPRETWIAGGTRAVEGAALAATIREREDSYRRIVEQSPHGLFICADGRIEYANPAFARIAGAKDPAQLRGTVALDIFHADHRALLRETIRKVLAGERKTSPVEQEIIRLDGSTLDAEMTVLPYTHEGRDAVMVVVEDITRRKWAEEDLRIREKDLEEKSAGLSDTNAALKVLIAQRNEDKEALQNTVLANIKELVFPYLHRVRSGRLSEAQAAYMDMIESGLNHVVSPFLQKLTGAYSQLTPAEVQVADMIRSGKTSKEIASLLNICRGTVEGHRISIRKKLGLSNKKVNLQSYLSSM